MENEIKVNEYIRTKRGIIDKAVKILDNYIFLKSKFFITEYGESSTFIKKTDIVKHSNNLIDIIEEGDYVNGEIVDKIFNPRFLSFGELPYIITANNKYEPQEIEEIVTKEMMESISYKLIKM